MIADPNFTRLGPRPPAADRSGFRGQKLQNIVADVMNTPSDEVEDVNAIMRKPH
jgi:hypothetical protein